MSTRQPDQLRPTSIEPFATHAAGSVIIRQGGTCVLCTSSIEPEVPAWLPRDEDGAPLRGWVTAEYAMLPGSTGQRKRRGPDGRGTEIQRLIGRVLRASVDLEAMPGLCVTCDCDVLVADGGTRTASITGAMVALAQALSAAHREGRLMTDPIRHLIAAVSVGVVDGEVWLDLDYELDVKAEVDMNIAMDDASRFVEVQGTAEASPFSRQTLDTMLDRAAGGIEQLIQIQRSAINGPESGETSRTAR